MARNFASCICCSAVYPVSAMVRTEMPNRGNRNAYMCSECARINRSYHAVNRKVCGTEKRNAVCVGIEYESSYTDNFARNVMFEFGFIPTHDCSLVSDTHESRYHGGWSNDGTTCEYVTGIWNGLNKASKFAVTAESMISDGHMKVNDSCGTHFHVSVNNMKDAHGDAVYMGYIRRFYNSLFVPLCDAMKANPEATGKLFGRYFTGYAREINMYTSQTCHDDRYYFINCLADSNIEFRLNKFVSAKQYQELMKFEVEVVKCVVTNFCEHFNDTDIDNRRYPTRTAYRKHKAQVTAKKIVKLFEKFAANV